MMIQVFICDDHKLVAEGVSLMLAGEPGIEVSGFAHDGERVVTLVKEGEKFADVLLLDINLPGINGIDVCRIVKQSFPGIKVIALTMLKELSLVKLILKNGADGFLVKNAGKQEVIEAINTVMSGNRFVDDELKNLLLNDFVSQAKPRSSYELVPSLSRREKEVLQLILDEYTAPEIAEKLFISQGTVETHKRNLLAKLGVRNTAGLVRMALEYDLLNK